MTDLKGGLKDDLLAGLQAGFWTGELESLRAGSGRA